MMTAKWPRVFALLTLAAAFIVLIAGPGISSGLLPWQLGLLAFAVSALVCAIGSIALLVALARKATRTPAKGLLTTGLIAGLLGAGVPAAIVLGASNAPPIHDITTDMDNPPAFVAITAELRGPDSNPVSYDPAIAPKQAEAYPQIRPMRLAATPEEAFARAEAAARAMGWEIVATDQPALRIEATATVPWWGFKDDVVIRLTPDSGATIIDVRSKSRVGQGDLGVNAERITAYLDKLANG
ncbi:MAG: DUF1499 domain-containing protein [Polymorphobacter sp.]|uniref:DUF1499 domain-containing protein n=1 Tax=Polymorphobacter sp. TaxID=1909290 RepID=UPI003A89ECCA